MPYYQKDIVLRHISILELRESNPSLKAREIGERLGLSPETVSNTLRGQGGELKKMKQILQELDGQDKVVELGAAELETEIPEEISYPRGTPLWIIYEDRKEAEDSGLYKPTSLEGMTAKDIMREYDLIRGQRGSDHKSTIQDYTEDDVLESED